MRRPEEDVACQSEMRAMPAHAWAMVAKWRVA